ncbi:interferon regulatory factor 8-like isoform X2 [Manis pentadactyla]|uniref:interferon regulatory factor 8-like isoform X2 n=1 Tax=Manis pentadactyla TaxID=143292 RepID=UPI00255C31C1|nr:interferon regulatory factor 8-like isoform X2 [Manis pentadactyla]
MAEAEGSLRLRDWLVAQIESGGYAGLRWEDAGKTVFRIHWKHAAKQGYQARQDATIFRDGSRLATEDKDKEQPPGWPSRAPCHQLPCSQALWLTTGPRNRTLHTPRAPCPSSASVTLH